MALSKQHRIIILLIIDSVFFFLELVVGKLLLEIVDPHGYIIVVANQVYRLCRPLTGLGGGLLPYGTLVISISMRYWVD
jgi:hypothetical protein